MQADYPKYIDAKMSMFVRKTFVFTYIRFTPGNFTCQDIDHPYAINCELISTSEVFKSVWSHAGAL
jgi:hypothetical protein